MNGGPFLSIVVPFHNSVETCGPLLETLRSLDGREGIELIFVDDGSTDGTRSLLADFSKHSRVPVRVVHRDRGGPGAARNSGLDHATGKFVWFVDSDDNIDLGAVSLAKEANWPEVDLIAWDWEHPNIARRIVPGLHSTVSGPVSPDVLDPIVSNWFSLSFLKRTRLRFPEFCFYEATPLEAFVLPLLVDDYLAVDQIAYRGNAATLSVTRVAGGFAPGHYDSLRTVPLGMAFARDAEVGPAAREDFEAAFIRLFLWYRIRLSRLPGLSWVRAARVMRQYREEAKRFGIRLDPLTFFPGRRHSKPVMRFLWLVSAGLPSQEGYFRRLRKRVWAHDILWEPPEMPARYRRAAVTPLPPTVTGEGKSLQEEAGS